MNWSKIKNIMIGILVVINLFLLADIGFTEYFVKPLPEGTGESFVNILGKRSITLDERLIPYSYETRSEITAKFYTIDELTQMLIKDNVKYSSDGQRIIAASDNKRLVMTGMMLEYTRLKESAKKNGRDIIKALDKAGFDTTYARWSEDEGLVRLVVDSVVVEGVYLDVSLADDGEFTHVKGVWPKVWVKDAKKSASVVSAVTEICEEIPEGSRIEDIEALYVFKDTNHTPEVVPGWRIHTGGMSYVVS